MIETHPDTRHHDERSQALARMFRAIFPAR